MSGSDASNYYGYQTDYTAQQKLLFIWHHTGETGNPLYYDTDSGYSSSWTEDPAKKVAAGNYQADNIDKVNARLMALSSDAAEQTAQSWATMGSVLTEMRKTFGNDTDALLNGTKGYGRWNSKAALAFAAKGPGAAMKSLDDWVDAAARNHDGLMALSGIITEYQAKMDRLYSAYLDALNRAEHFYVDGLNNEEKKDDFQRARIIDLMRFVRDDSYPMGDPDYHANALLRPLRAYAGTVPAEFGGGYNWSAAAFKLESAMGNEFSTVISSKLLDGRAKVYEGETNAVTIDDATLKKVLQDYTSKNLPSTGNVPNLNNLTKQVVPTFTIPGGSNKPNGDVPDPNNTPDPGQPPVGETPDPGQVPDPGTVPDPGQVPDPGTVPNPGQVPDPGSVPNPGTAPDPGLAPNPGLAPALATATNPVTAPTTGGLSATPPSTSGLPGQGNLPPGLQNNLGSKPTLSKGLISRTSKTAEKAPGSPGLGSPPGAPGLGRPAGEKGVRRGVLGRPAGATPQTGAPGLPGDRSRRLGNAPPGSSGITLPGDELSAGAAPPSTAPVLGSQRRADVPGFTRPGQQAPSTGLRAGSPDGASPSVLHAPRGGTAPGAPGLPPPGTPATRRRDGVDRPGLTVPDPTSEWVVAPGTEEVQATTPVIDGSARAARLQSQQFSEAGPTTSKPGSGVLRRSSAQDAAAAQRSAHRRGEPEQGARRLTTAFEAQHSTPEEQAPAVVTDEQAFNVASPGGGVLANAPRQEPDRGLG
jgi:hypothetical protein